MLVVEKPPVSAYPGEECIQQALHEHNIIQLTYLEQVEGYPRKQILSSDGSGCALFPLSDWMWPKWGAKNAFRPTKVNRRRYTFDLLQNEAGEIVNIHVTFK